MKRIYTTPNYSMLCHVKNMMELHGIRCLVRGDKLMGGAGELPPIECWPELWIVEDAEEEEARRTLVKLLRFAGPTSRPWTCAGCGEELMGQFTDCWNCGASRCEGSSKGD